MVIFGRNELIVSNHPKSKNDTGARHCGPTLNYTRHKILDKIGLIVRVGLDPQAHWWEVGLPYHKVRFV